MTNRVRPRGKQQGIEETWRQIGKGSWDDTSVCRHQDRKLVEIILGSLEILMNSSARSSE